MDELAAALAEAGGIDAPREAGGRLRKVLAGELRRSAAELEQRRSGYEVPVTVAIAPGDGALLAALPLDPALRADPGATGERGWLLAAAAIGAAAQAGATGELTAGELDGRLVLRVVGGDDAELAALAFDESLAGVDRLRARALAIPGHVLGEATGLRAPIGVAHPLVVAAKVARLGGDPVDPASMEEHEDAVLASEGSVARPHDDPDPSRRVARRILQRLDGMGKWGGYHTEFAHLARGFAGNDRRLAEEVGEALLDAGLLRQKPSVGQRHVFLDPRRAADIRALIDRGELPPDVRLPAPL